MESLKGKVKFGIIGCSRVARKNMLPAILNSKAAAIGMIGSRSPEKAAEYAKEFHCDAYGSYEDILKNDAIDAVYISLPVGLHEEWAIKAAEAGKHILCEKSSTTSLESASKMVAACSNNQVRIMEGFGFRFHPQHSRVASLIEDGSTGELLEFQGSFGFPFPKGNDIRLKNELGGGVLNDAAGYPVYASRMLLKAEPLSIYCKLIIDPKYKVDVKADAFLRYGDGKTALISAAFGAYFQSTYSLWGRRAHLTVKRAYAVPRDMETNIVLSFENNGKDEENNFKIPPADQFQLMVENFCQAVTKTGEKEYNFESDLLAQARVLEAARISSREDRAVNIKELPH